MLAVINDAAGSRQRSGFIEHQPQAGIFDPPDPSGVDPVPPRLAIDDTAERPGREPGDPGDTTPQPREEAADIEFAAADPNLEQPRLIEPLLAGRGQPQQCFAERQQIIAAVERRAAAGRQGTPDRMFRHGIPLHTEDASVSQEPRTRNPILIPVWLIFSSRAVIQNHRSGISDRHEVRLSWAATLIWQRVFAASLRKWEGGHVDLAG